VFELQKKMLTQAWLIKQFLPKSHFGHLLKITSIQMAWKNLNFFIKRAKACETQKQGDLMMLSGDINEL
jgi:hypothetical protein